MILSDMVKLYTEAEQIFDKFLQNIDKIPSVKDVIDADFGTIKFVEYDYGKFDKKYKNLLISFNNDDYMNHIHSEIINFKNSCISIGEIHKNVYDSVIIHIPVEKNDFNNLVNVLIENKFYVIHNIVHYLDFKVNGVYTFEHNIKTDKQVYNSLPEFKAIYLEAIYNFCHTDYKIKDVEDLKFKLRKYFPNKFRTLLTDKNKSLFNDLTNQLYSTLNV